MQYSGSKNKFQTSLPNSKLLQQIFSYVIESVFFLFWLEM